MGDIRKAMPVLARHEGDWEGVYIHVDIDNKEIDRHRSKLQCMFPAEGPFAYHQINTYIWDDGREEEIHFPATFRDNRIWWDTDRIEGSAWEIDERTVVLTWTRKGEPGTYLYEMIQLSEDGQHRGRTWHWFNEDKLFKRTCIKETRVR
ncbi:MAG: DUF3598 domain-containing protein [Pseudomonadota bacterium]|uniref:hypothetical protein n=1 Tax=unclassified Phenylobacterium TaxID=2640670 RepID=UPI0006F6A302|nr:MULTISPECIES: hypothetical protein [unclassified Phenylobacterium]KRB40148.1 hypothetical protein ASE02_10250 [Phenylobacterium sp. Root700]MBT9469810.1 DUF3598 domain-containing protein [Phenylobacterium sp.]